MKFNIKIQGVLFALFLMDAIVYAQIGINTDHPLGIFHVDGAGDTTPAGVNSTNDFIVSENGNIGIGALASSTAKMKIVGESPLSLVDGKQGSGYILQAKDDAGNLEWVKPPEAWANTFQITDATTILNGYDGERVLLRTTLPYDGTYFVTLRFRATITRGSYTTFPGSGDLVSAYFSLRTVSPGTTLPANLAQIPKLDETEFYYSFYDVNAVVSFNVNLLGDFVAGQDLVLSIFTSIPRRPIVWYYGGRTNDIENPSVIIFKL